MSIFATTLPFQLGVFKLRASKTLTPHQQDQVKAMLKDRKSIRAIARHLNVGVATIDRIKRKTDLL